MCTCSDSMLRRIVPILSIFMLFLSTPSVRGQAEVQRYSSMGSAAPANPDATNSESAYRVREGSTLSRIEGTFKMSGDRISFYPEDGQASFRILENLRWNGFGESWINRGAEPGL